MEALISIKPKYVEKIISGEKTIELRKTIFKKPVEKIWVYTTVPIKKIQGYFIIDKIIEDTPLNIWKDNEAVLGIDIKSYFDYFDGKEKAYGIKIKKWVAEEREMIFNPPQSFMYINSIFSK